MTLRFSPWGLGGRLEPPSSARFLAESLTYATLADDVPEDVRLNFERVCKLFLYGLLEYDLFSAADDLAHLVLEGALRHRFVTYYEGRIPIWRDGVADVVKASTFSDYRDALGMARRQGQKLRLGEKDPEGPPRGYSDLYAWARRRGLLFGQRNVGVFGSLVRLRDYVAHPERHQVDMPPDVIRLLRDIAEIINRLWGHNTEGGRLFPGPIRRRPRAAALSPDRQAAVTFGSLQLVPAERDKSDWTYALFLAADGEELVELDWDKPGQHRFLHTPGFQMTQYPTELLWGPGRQDGLVAVLSDFDDQITTDTVAFQDRTFFIRTTAGSPRPEFPRSPSDVLSLGLNDAAASWYVMCADFPMDAWVLVRDAADTLASRPSRTGFIRRLVGDEAARRYVTSTHSAG